MRKPAKCRIKIRGQRWTVIAEKPPLKGAIGLCDYGTKTLYVKPGAEFRATLIHEILHACFADFEESAIIEAEEAIEAGLDLITTEE